jgi:dTMP kinase
MVAVAGEGSTGARPAGGGSYIAFEGVEGAGKSTVARRVAHAVAASGAHVVEVREPGSTEAGESIRQVLLHGEVLEPWTEALLFAAQRAQLAAEVIRPALAIGSMVITDRSVYSSLAYQGGGRRLGVEKVRFVNEQGLGGTWPDRVVLLRVDPTTGMSRQEIADRIGAEPTEFLDRVAITYDRLAAGEPERFIVIDAALPLGAVVEAALEAIGPIVGPDVVEKVR